MIEAKVKAKAKKLDPKVLHSTKKVGITIAKPFNGLKAGDKVTVSESTAAILKHRGLIK